MVGHSSLPTIREVSSEIEVSGFKYSVVVSTHHLPGLKGNALGVKFTNDQGSMDATIKSKGVDSFAVVNALAVRTQQMILPSLSSTAMIGFYLLTDGLEARGEDAARAKIRLYNMGARRIHQSIKHQLPLITRLQVESAFAWVISKEDMTHSRLLFGLQKEFGRRVEVL